MTPNHSTTEAYESDDFSLFSPEELQRFHEFHSYDWDEDSEFQRGLKSIYPTIPTDEQKLLKAKQFYFARIKYPIDIDNYLKFETVLKNSMPAANEKDDSVYARFDGYDFSTDEKFLSGLPNVITELAKNKPGAMVEKAYYDREMLKARTFYYSKFVEHLDLAEYLAWKEAKTVTPACPYAHLWQNKGSREATAPTDSNEFLKVEEPTTSRGAFTLTITAPRTNNILTCERLQELETQIHKAINDDTYTAIILASHCTQSEVPERDPDQPITNVDHKSISAGLALKETVEDCEHDLEVTANSIDHLQDTYYSLLKELEQHTGDNKKPVFQLIDGAIPFSAAQYYLSPGQTRIITEHSYVSLGIDSFSHAPIPPLYILSHIARSTKDKATRALPQGSALYVALAPTDLLLLRGPELLRLGLADYFIPDSKYIDTLKEMKNNAPCPAPHTSEAIKVVLEMNKAYAGPDKVGVWAKEIEQAFGASSSLEDIYDNLGQISKAWSKTIVGHLKAQSPTLLEMVVRAINRVTEEDLGWDECIELEAKLNAHWRRTQDYKMVVEGHKISEPNSPLWPDLDLDFVTGIFESTRPPLLQNKIKDYHITEVTTTTTEEEISDDEEIFVCPVTGMRGKMPDGHAPVALHSST